MDGGTELKIIAFYLPQYYEFEENNKWWGKGFTEWTNVKKVKPLYKGHYQPTVPLNKNFYTLENIETMRWQVNLAKKYSIYGFCFYHYWFGNNRQLMEKPVDRYLKSKELDLPFCLSWANHNWTRTWTGGDKEILMDMQYGDGIEWKRHFEYLDSFFKDERYIKIDGKPLLIIYAPHDIPNLNEMLTFFNKMAIKSGHRGITYAAQSSFGKKQENLPMIDYFIQYEPNCARLDAEANFSISNIFRIGKTSLSFALDIQKVRIRRKIKSISKNKVCRVNTYKYDAIWSYILKRKIKSNKLLAGAFVNSDVTPRRQDRAIIYRGASPKKFQVYMEKLLKKVKNEYSQSVVFLSAWNEWGEGMYLEPDEKNGYGYLEAIRNVIEHGDSLYGVEKE